MSVSVTRTFLQREEGTVKGFRKQRVHDYLYDPVYTVSSEIDHARVTFKAHKSLDRVRKVPVYESMFSNLPHHPRFALRLDTVDPVPAFIDRRWHGRMEQRKNALQQVSSFRAEHHFQSKIRDDCNISGSDRWKFFKRPLVPFSQQVPPDVVFALPRANPYSSVTGALEQPQTPFQRTVGVQTDYRESEAQTDPYSPDYVVRPGSAPELLTLATLTWGHGLPVGLAEVEMIERARIKRAWEATLPPLDNLAQLDKRKRMMDEMERKEWAFREEEIHKLQEARLGLLMKLLLQREEKQQEAMVMRLDKQFLQRQRDKDAKIKKIRKDYIISIRKLTEKRRNVEGKLKRRDIIKDYSDYASQTYAPLSRNGLFSDRNSERNLVKSRYLSTYEGLLELEAGLLASVTQPTLKAPKPKVTKGFIKRSVRQQMELTKTHQALKDKKLRTEEKKTLRFLYKIEKPTPRPPTPVVEAPPEGDEEKELAIIYLQKMLRGRAVQNMMFEGKEKHLELIQELRTTHALQREEQELQKADKQVTLALQRQRELHNNQVSMAEGLQAGMVGGVVADMLDFLSKELVRLQEEQRIHALVLLAERDRRLREAEESGRRQVEERRRREEDEIFKQVVQVHQKTVDLYLEDIILGAIEKTADEQAREEIHRVAEEINNVAYAMEETRTHQQSEEIVAELVYSFLIPEVQKITIRDRVRQSQRRHLQAAHRIIHGETDTSAAPAQEPQRPTSPSTRASTRVLEELITHMENLAAAQHQTQEEEVTAGKQLCEEEEKDENT